MSIVMGILGFGAWFGTAVGMHSDDEFNKDYYNGKDEPLFKRKHDKGDE
ncbi:MAG: hypothetical protein RSC16_04880 [Enterococcus sp.]